MFELCNVTAGYGTTTVLRDVSLVVPAGSVVALLGSNGAGKTTLLRAASGLIPARGRITLDGQDLSGHHPHDFARAGICHVPEGRGIFRSLTVRDNIVLQAGSGSIATAIDRATSVFPILGQRLGQIAGTLSGGQQQMLALARAYVTNPKVVLLDEVSMGLAPVVVDEIFDFLGRLAAEGTSLLIVEQYVTRALKLSDYVFLLNRGQVGFAGEPGELDVDELFTSYMGRSAEAAVPV